MKLLIQKMMSWANVSPEQLKQEQTIPTSFGQTLSWKYWEYAKKIGLVNGMCQQKFYTPEKIILQIVIP